MIGFINNLFQKKEKWIDKSFLKSYYIYCTAEQISTVETLLNNFGIVPTSNKGVNSNITEIEIITNTDVAENIKSMIQNNRIQAEFCYVKKVFENIFIDEPLKKNLEYDASGNLVYEGLASPSASDSDSVWRIRKFSYNGFGQLLTEAYADGSKKFDKVWNNRTLYSYS